MQISLLIKDIIPQSVPKKINNVLFLGLPSQYQIITMPLSLLCFNTSGLPCLHYHHVLPNYQTLQTYLSRSNSLHFILQEYHCIGHQWYHFSTSTIMPPYSFMNIKIIIMTFMGICKIECPYENITHDSFFCTLVDYKVSLLKWFLNMNGYFVTIQK